MNSLIEILNKWGGRFLDFAVPIFWQAGLLIVALLAFDFLFRHKVRASVRYALWLVVLVKLILPPALALPTSPAWWLHSNQLAISAKPVIKNYTVSYDSSPLPDNSLKTFTAFVPPKPVMTWAAWLLVLSAVVSAGLFVWLLARWWQITRQVSGAKTSERLTAIIAQARLLAGVRGEPPVKLTANTMSPAVCGLFRPAILIPESLAEHFSEEQMRAVLLHELIHLRRRDVWLNFCQSLLQIVYWWHPLVWVANVRIRRVREEAVDDAVMLALAGEAETYAPTLLEVAKLALNRPLASLGLVGILESRSALRERIERLVDFRAPRRAGLTLVSIFGVLAFSAVAVPMGGAPASTEEKASEISEVLSPVAAIPKTNAPVILVTSYFYRLSAGDFETAVSNLKFKEGETTNDPYWVASPDDFSQLIKNLKSSGQQLYLSPRIVTASGIEAATYIGDGTNRGSGLDVRPVIEGGLVNMRIVGDTVLKSGEVTVTNRFGITALMSDASGIVVRPGGKENDLLVAISIRIETNGYHERLERIVKKTQPSAEDIAKVANMVQDAKIYYEMGKFADAEASANSALVLNPDNAAATYYLKLIAESRQKQHEAMAGMPPPKRPKSLDKLDQIQIDQFGPFVNTPLGQVMRELSEAAKRSDLEKQGITFLIGSPLGDPAKPSLDVNSVCVNLPSVLKHVKMDEVLDAIKKGSTGPINFWFQDTTIAYWAEDRRALFLRTFRIDFETLKMNLRKQAGLEAGASPEDVAKACRVLFSKAGVDWSLPKGKSVFYDDHRGILFVKATEPDLDVIERSIQTIMDPLQIHIKARFFEVPKGAVAGMEKSMVITNQPISTNGSVGILANENFKTTLQSLERLPGTEELAEPEVTTLSGRETQVRSTEFVGVMTNFALVENPTNGVDAVVPQVGQVEIGTMLDVVPHVLADGYKISLKLIPSFTEFLGYETPPSQHFSTTDTSIHLPVILPHFRVRQSVVTTVVDDNQTVVLGDLPVNDYVGGKESSEKSKADNKELVVLITATVVDAAGNRVHSDEALAAIQN